MSSVKDDKIKIHEDKVIIEPHRPDLKEKIFFLISGIIVSIPITLLFETLAGNVSTVLPIFIAASSIDCYFCSIYRRICQGISFILQTW